MKVLVDTSVWSLALRKKTSTKKEASIEDELKELIKELRVIMIGPIRQELLSGIKDYQKYENLREKLRPFDDLALNEKDYEKAAHIYNECKHNGIQGSHTDFLIVSIVINRDLSLFTADRDFLHINVIAKIPLHQIRTPT